MRARRAQVSCGQMRSVDRETMDSFYSRQWSGIDSDQFSRPVTDLLLRPSRSIRAGLTLQR